MEVLEVVVKKLDPRNIYFRPLKFMAMATIASESFSGMRPQEKALEWIRASFLAWPRMQYFVAESSGIVVGYILWVEKGGFREESVWELEQIAVSEKCRGQKVGTKMILESLQEIKKYLYQRGSWLKLVEVTTGTHNTAQRLYEDTLGAKRECAIRDLFGGDEAIMVARFSKP